MGRLITTLCSSCAVIFLESSFPSDFLLSSKSQILSTDEHDATWRSPMHPKKRYSLKLAEVRGSSDVKVAKRTSREVPEIYRCPVGVRWSSRERSMIRR